MSVVDGVTSIEEMEGLLQTAIDMVRENPSNANKAFLHDIKLAYKSKDWLFLTALRYIKELSPKLIFVKDSSVQVNEGTQGTVLDEFTEGKYDLLLQGFHFRAKWDSEPFLTHDKAVTVGITTANITIYQKQYTHSRLYDTGKYEIEFTYWFPRLIRIPVGHGISVYFNNWSGVNTATDGAWVRLLYSISEFSLPQEKVDYGGMVIP